jgi:hypothetical protein
MSYQDTMQEPVEIVVFHDPDFQEPWFLLVPAGSEAQLPTAEVVALYRERMHIELTFRDWKTHLGVRGLRLEVDVADDSRPPHPTSSAPFRRLGCQIGCQESRSWQFSQRTSPRASRTIRTHRRSVSQHLGQ